MEKELILENLIKGKGFEDAVIFFGDDSVNVIVKTQGLDDKQVAQICDIVSKGTGLSLDKITIIERK
jgi:stage III sporulation protein AH